jgi:hypothetical protein
VQNLAVFYIDIPGLRPRTAGAHAFAFLCAAVATALRIAIDPYVVGVPFTTYFPAVIITALISGFGAGPIAQTQDPTSRIPSCLV